MKVAVCFHGQPRALTTSVLDLFPGADVFAHAWYDGSGSYDDVGLTDASYSVALPRSYISDMFAALGPRKCVLEPPPAPGRATFGDFGKVKPGHVAPMCQSIARSLALARQTDDYDWYVKARYDVVVAADRAPIALEDDGVVYAADVRSGLPDPVVMAIPRTFVDAFADVASYMGGAIGIEEHIMASIAAEHGFEFRSLGLGYTIDRETFRRK